MKHAPHLLAIVLALSAQTVWAAGPSCHAAAADKKIHGAAKTSFLKKCEKDAAAACESQAAEKKIHGAAKNSFTQKCVKDAVGAPPPANPA